MSTSKDRAYFSGVETLSAAQVLRPHCPDEVLWQHQEALCVLPVLVCARFEFQPQTKKHVLDYVSIAVQHGFAFIFSNSTDLTLESL